MPANIDGGGGDSSVIAEDEQFKVKFHEDALKALFENKSPRQFIEAFLATSDNQDEDAPSRLCDLVRQKLDSKIFYATVKRHCFVATGGKVFINTAIMDLSDIKDEAKGDQ